MFIYAVLFMTTALCPILNAAVNPAIGSIRTSDMANLNLESGSYNMSIKVWLDEDASIKSFHTYIHEPWLTVEWDLSNVTKGEWVELKQKIELVEDANNAKLSINVANGIHNLGNEIGNLYIDDIYLLKTGGTSIEEIAPNFECKIYPNPTSNYINVCAPEGSSIQVFSMSGKLLQQTTAISKTNRVGVNYLPEGIYLVKINSMDGSVSQKIIIE